MVSIRDIAAGDALTMENVWVKRPGTGEIKAAHFETLLGKKARRALPVNAQLAWADVE